MAHASPIVVQPSRLPISSDQVVVQPSRLPFLLIKESCRRDACTTSKRIPGGPGTAPAPVFFAPAEPCHDRIVLDILDKPFQVLDAADEMVKPFAFPESAGAIQDLVCLMSRVGLPGVVDVVRRVLAHCGIDHVQMVPHDAPGVQVITPSVKVLHRVLHHLGNSWVCQNARSQAQRRLRLGSNFFARFLSLSVL
jgi:hypothetical protein